MSKTIKGAVAGSALAIAVGIVSQFEGLRTDAYVDPVGIPTICYGETAGVKLGQTHTEAECKAMLAGRLGQSFRVVDATIKRPMPDTRRAALASFEYNVGAVKFAGSSVAKKLASGDVQGGCDALLQWVYAGGRKLPGLVKRRDEERALCLK